MAGEISTGEIYGRCHFLKEWLFWDVSIHAGQAQIERQGRAMTYPFSFKINRSAQAGTFSSTSDLPFYSTTLSECNCYDFQNRHLPCKHMYFLSFKIVQPNSQTTLGNSGYFRGLSFAIAGSSQEKIKKFITQRKGKVTDKVNMVTTALIVNTSKTTQKITDAQIHSVEMLTFDDLKELF